MIVNDKTRIFIKLKNPSAQLRPQARLEASQGGLGARGRPQVHQVRGQEAVRERGLAMAAVQVCAGGQEEEEAGLAEEDAFRLPDQP